MRGTLGLVVRRLEQPAAPLEMAHNLILAHERSGAQAMTRTETLGIGSAKCGAPPIAVTFTDNRVDAVTTDGRPGWQQCGVGQRRRPERF